MASISNKAPSRASFDICTAVEAGAIFDHVVKVTVYFTDMANLQAYFEVRDRYVNTKAPPRRARA